MSTVKYAVVDNSISPFLTNIPSNLRTTVENVNGHLIYNNLWRNNLNVDISLPDARIVNGVGVSKKDIHFVINPSWNEQRLQEEMAYAFANKKNKISSKIVKIKVDSSTKIEVVETRFTSRFSEGTNVEIIHRSKGIDPVNGSLVNDHIALFAIKK